MNLYIHEPQRPPFSLFWAMGRRWDYFIPLQPPPHLTWRRGKEKQGSDRDWARQAKKQGSPACWASVYCTVLAKLNSPLTTAQLKPFSSVLGNSFGAPQGSGPAQWLCAENSPLHAGVTVVVIRLGEGRERRYVCVRVCVAGGKGGKRGGGTSLEVQPLRFWASTSEGMG